MRLAMLALVAAAVAGMTYVLADSGPATAVLTPSEIEAAKAVNRQYPAPAEPAGLFATTSGRVDLDVEPRDDEPAAAAMTEPVETARRRPAASQRAQARKEEPGSREWTGKFFER